LFGGEQEDNIESRAEVVRTMLGTVETEYIYRIADALIAADGPALLAEARALTERSLSLLARFTPFATGAMYTSDAGFFISTTRDRVKYKIFSRDPRVELTHLEEADDGSRRGERDRVGEREAGCAVAGEAFNQLLHGHVAHRPVDAETRCVVEREQIDQGAEILRGRLAERHKTRRQRRQFRAPIGRSQRCGFVAHGHTIPVLSRFLSNTSARSVICP
jgi:hypothetical protein